jgi:hypothetical protein
MTSTEVRLPPDQLDWLSGVLTGADLPSLVLSHHPFGEMDLTANRWFATEPHLCHVVERVEARRVIGQGARVLAALNGHVHWNHLAVHQGLPYVTVQSLIENLDEDAPGRPARAFAILDVLPTHLHLEWLGEHELRMDLDRRDGWG